MRSFILLVAIALIAVACQPTAITISVGASPTPTVTATPTLNLPATADAQAAATANAQATANARATADAQAQATANAQAQATANAQALATATARAQATATAQAQATATAQTQATANARAAAAATTQALVAAINAMVDAQTARPYIVKEETVPGKPAPYITTYNPELDMRNFAAEIQFTNPADPKVHTWDFGFIFRRGGKSDQYRLVLRSDRIWYLILIDESLADSVDGKLIADGIIPNLNLSTDGTNTFRLVVKDKQAFLFVNNQYIAAMDVSARLGSGFFVIGTGFDQDTMFPGVKLHFKNLNVKWLP